MLGKRPAVSLVIPVYNEEEGLASLFAALDAVVPELPQPVEYVLIDDGSRDRSMEIMRAYRSPVATVQVVELAANFGQHAAVLAGFEHAAGDIIVTLDADLQNPPSEIPKLVAKVQEGYDAVAGWRRFRKDPASRKLVSWMMNRTLGRATGHYLHDYGCMLRAYSRQVIDGINRCHERQTYVPVLANGFAKRVTEVEVNHAEREIGVTKYSWGKLWRLNIDLLTSLTTVPLHWVSMGGLLVAMLGLAFAAFLMIRRLMYGPGDDRGVFTLFSVLFFFIGTQIFATGIIGEYLARINDQVRGRPQFLVREVYTAVPNGDLALTGTKE
ncbi:MAG: glycosyltransferase [Armatimonadota bacterium]